MKQEKVLREYRFSTQSNTQSFGTVGSGAQLLNIPMKTGAQRLIIKARGDSIFFNFGGAGIVASNTITGQVYPDGNFSLEAGQAAEIDINGATQAYVDVINETQATGAVAIVQVCTMLNK